MQSRDSLLESTLTRKKLERYSRHSVMPEIGLEGQTRLESSSVLVVGAGGLGTPAVIYPAAAGAGRIGLVDYDAVQASNLHRQVLYSEEDVGKKKVDVARSRLLQINPHIEIDTYDTRLDSTNTMKIFRGYDAIVDVTDNFPASYLTNDACALLAKPDVYVGVFRFDGQATVFFAKSGPYYRCLYHEPPPPASVPSCAEARVLGVLPGIMGGIKEAETINLILRLGDPFIGRLTLLNTSDMRFTEIRIGKNPDCPMCGTKPSVRELVDYEAFCGVARVASKSVPEVAPVLLKKWLNEGKEVELLGVREPFEY